MSEVSLRRRSKNIISSAAGNDQASNEVSESGSSEIVSSSSEKRRASYLQKSKDGSLIYTRRSSSYADNSTDGKRPLGYTVDSQSKFMAKRRRNIVTNANGIYVEKDMFCWVCHTDGEGKTCEMCTRFFHVNCITKNIVCPVGWICSECERVLAAEERMDSLMRMAPLEHISQMFKFALQKMKFPESEPFFRPVDSAVVPTYTDIIFNPMDFATIEKKIKSKKYGSTDAFLADVKWILHNCIIFNGEEHVLSNNAKLVVKICKQQMSDIDICHECYYNAVVYSNDDPFCMPCSKPHPLVWAKMKGYPFWPAKCLKEEAGMCDVRFFGEHDRSKVPTSQVFLLSEEPPSSMKKSKTMEMAMLELTKYIENYRVKFGCFEYAQPRTNFNPLEFNHYASDYDDDQIEYNDQDFDNISASNQLNRIDIGEDFLTDEVSRTSENSEKQSVNNFENLKNDVELTLSESTNQKSHVDCEYGINVNIGSTNVDIIKSNIATYKCSNIDKTNSSIDSIENKLFNSNLGEIHIEKHRDETVDTDIHEIDYSNNVKKYLDTDNNLNNEKESILIPNNLLTNSCKVLNNLDSSALLLNSESSNSVKKLKNIIIDMNILKEKVGMYPCKVQNNFEIETTNIIVNDDIPINNTNKIKLNNTINVDNFILKDLMVTTSINDTINQIKSIDELPNNMDKSDLIVSMPKSIGNNFQNHIKINKDNEENLLSINSSKASFDQENNSIILQNCDAVIDKAVETNKLKNDIEDNRSTNRLPNKDGDIIKLPVTTNKSEFIIDFDNRDNLMDIDIDYISDNNIKNVNKETYKTCNKVDAENHSTFNGNTLKDLENKKEAQSVNDKEKKEYYDLLNTKIKSYSDQAKLNNIEKELNVQSGNGNVVNTTEKETEFFFKNNEPNPLLIEVNNTISSYNVEGNKTIENNKTCSNELNSVDNSELINEDILNLNVTIPTNEMFNIMRDNMDSNFSVQTQVSNGVNKLKVDKKNSDSNQIKATFDNMKDIRDMHNYGKVNPVLFQITSKLNTETTQKDVANQSFIINNNQMHEQKQNLADKANISNIVISDSIISQIRKNINSVINGSSDSRHTQDSNTCIKNSEKFDSLISSSNVFNPNKNKLIAFDNGTNNIEMRIDYIVNDKNISDNISNIKINENICENNIDNKLNINDSDAFNNSDNTVNKIESILISDDIDRNNTNNEDLVIESSLNKISSPSSVNNEINFNGFDFTEYSTKLVDFMKKMCQDMINLPAGNTFRRHLDLELKRMKFKQEQQIAALKYNNALQIAEMRIAFEIEKERMKQEQIEKSCSNCTKMMKVQE